MDIPHERRFHFGDGTSAGSADELRKKVEGMSYYEFYRHVNPGKNDFANWVRHVLKEEQLAQDLEKVTSIVETVEILNDHAHPLSLKELHESLQRRIEEDMLGVRAPLDLEEAEKELARPTQVPEAAQAQAAREDAADAFARTRTMTEQDYTRLIVKDFMYGLVFGLIIGLVLGRIISL
jgi:hypothetical protein